LRRSGTPTAHDAPGTFNAGYGSSFNADGDVEMDASIWKAEDSGRAP
jgi:isoaspartyl peptidase/L-asparaginase-like protein (Ntn-hydrolase superfamily)